MILDAVVVGGGPAGSTAAALLARRGFSVRLYDRARFPRDKPCGEFMSPAATPILEDLGVGPALEAAGARRLPRVRIVAHGAPLDLVFQAGPAGPDWCWSLSRRRLDATLLAAARSAGADVMEEVRVDGLLTDGDRVTGVTGRDPADRPVQTRARLVIGAGGRNCPVARALGLQRRDRRHRYDLLARWRADPADAGAACELHAAGDAYLAVAPQEGDRWNVNGVVSRDALRRAGDAEAAYAALLAAHPAVAERIAGGERRGGIEASDVTPLNTPRATADGALLVGDAALFLDPFTGQGIYLALRSAVLAAETAAAALTSGRTRRTDLAAYDAARAAEFGDKRRLSRAIQIILYRPWLARRVVRGLAGDPELSALVAAATGDTAPARLACSPRFGARVGISAFRP